MAISLSLVMIGIVSLAPTSSAKRSPANPQTNLSICCKAETGLSTIIQMRMAGALLLVKPAFMKTKAVMLIGVRTLSHSLSKCANT